MNAKNGLAYHLLLLNIKAFIGMAPGEAYYHILF